MNGPVLQNITDRFITEFRGQQTLPGREGSTSYLLPVWNNKYTVHNLEEICGVDPSGFNRHSGLTPQVVTMTPPLTQWLHPHFHARVHRSLFVFFLYCRSRKYPTALLRGVYPQSQRSMLNLSSVKWMSEVKKWAGRTRVFSVAQREPWSVLNSGLKADMFGSSIHSTAVSPLFFTRGRHKSINDWHGAQALERFKRTLVENQELV